MGKKAHSSEDRKKWPLRVFYRDDHDDEHDDEHDRRSWIQDYKQAVQKPSEARRNRVIEGDRLEVQIVHTYGAPNTKPGWAIGRIAGRWCYYREIQ